MKRYLIVKTSSIGDIIHAFDALSALKKEYPEALVDWVVEKPFADLLLAHPLIDNVITINTRRWRKNLLRIETLKEIFAFIRILRKIRYLALFDLQGNSKSAFVTLFAKAKDKVGFSYKTAPEWPNCLVTNRRYHPNSKTIRMRYLSLLNSYFNCDMQEGEAAFLAISEKEERRLNGIFSEKALSKSLSIVVSFSSNWENKTLSFHQLLLFLKEIEKKLDPSFLFIWKSESEKEEAERFKNHFPARSVTIGDMSLPFLQRLIGRANLLFAMDSAALHLAGTTSCLSFSFFGPSNSQMYKPPGKSHVAFQGVCPYNEEFENRCPHLRNCKSGACLKEQKVDMMLLLFQDQFPTHFSKKDEAQDVLPLLPCR